jgi:YidC/Oxa1 family membrane protein insertase
MERRLLLAIVLTFIVLTAYQWLVPVPQQAPVTKPTLSPATTPGGQTPAATPPSAPAVLPESSPVDAVTGESAERIVTVDNGLVRAMFSNRGATLTSWQLADYRGSDGKPVDLVPHDVPPDQPKPFSLKIEDAGKSARLNTALFATDTAAILDARARPVTLVFEYQDSAGLHARKQFRIDPHSYIITFSATVEDAGRPANPIVEWGPGLGDVLAQGRGGWFTPGRKAEAIMSANRKVERIQPNHLVTAPQYQGTYEFAGVDTHYFLSAVVKPGPAAMAYQPLAVPGAAADKETTRDYVAYTVRFTDMTAGPRDVKFFVGPKHFETLRRTDADLVRAVWFGMFAFLSVPLLSALNWVHSFVGNYGWSIIVLTVIINAAMFPLRHKSNVSMRKMQEIQPQVKAIQDRYAKLKMTDPARQKMNTELMELYRQKGVNPASGCVPMLLTFPVLLAFYGLLSESIELRGAPFILWIHDLAAADPYYVTPILMGASQVLQQRMMPMTGTDPVQQKMMLMMPVMFTFLFLTSPAGLALYWFASNVLVIGQQVLTNRLIGPPVVRVPRPPAERRVKKIGEDSTERI